MERQEKPILFTIWIAGLALLYFVIPNLFSSVSVCSRPSVESDSGIYIINSAVVLRSELRSKYCIYRLNNYEKIVLDESEEKSCSSNASELQTIADGKNQRLYMEYVSCIEEYNKTESHSILQWWQAFFTKAIR